MVDLGAQPGFKIGEAIGRLVGGMLFCAGPAPVEHEGDRVGDGGGLGGELGLQGGQAARHIAAGIARREHADGLEALGQPGHRSGKAVEGGGGLRCFLRSRGPEFALQLGQEVQHRLAVGRGFGGQRAQRGLQGFEPRHQGLCRRALQCGCRTFSAKRRGRLRDPALQLCGIAGGAQQELRRRRFARVADERAHQVADGGRDAVRGGPHG